MWGGVGEGGGGERGRDNETTELRKVELFSSKRRGTQTVERVVHIWYLLNSPSNAEKMT